MGLLNEVLSITAQECVSFPPFLHRVPVLNEVLSITAQEYEVEAGGLLVQRSSMKS